MLRHARSSNGLGGDGRRGGRRQASLPSLRDHLGGRAAAPGRRSAASLGAAASPKAGAGSFGASSVAPLPPATPSCFDRPTVKVGGAQPAMLAKTASPWNFLDAYGLARRRARQETAKEIAKTRRDAQLPSLQGPPGAAAEEWQSVQRPVSQLWSGKVLRGLVAQTGPGFFSSDRRQLAISGQADDAFALESGLSRTGHQDTLLEESDSDSDTPPGNASLQSRSGSLLVVDDDAARATPFRRPRGSSRPSIESAVDPRNLRRRDTVDVRALPVVVRQAAKKHHFSDEEIEQLRMGFNRFRIPAEFSMHTDDLCRFLIYLGHVMVHEEDVVKMLRDQTSVNYLEFPEVVKFMETFLAYEATKFLDIFEQFDEDGSGKIECDELRKVTKSLGYIPLHRMIEETLEDVDKNHSRALSFDQLINFFSTYRRRQSFTRSEVEGLRHAFNHHAAHDAGDANGRPTLPCASLTDALVESFGLQAFEISEALAGPLVEGRRSALAAGGAAQSLYFGEFLAAARKVREELLCELAAACSARQAAEGGGAGAAPARFARPVDAFEKLDGCRFAEAFLINFLGDLGYTLSRAVRDEIYQSVTGETSWGAGRELDFAEMFDFVFGFRRREGFTESDVVRMREEFSSCDDDLSGEISARELETLLDGKGYHDSIFEIEELITEVDANQSGELDFREYLRVMRLHRDRELEQIRREYDKHAGGLAFMPSKDAQLAVKALGYNVAEMEIPAAPDLDFEDFVAVVDAQRAKQVQLRCGKSSFPNETIERFREIFGSFTRGGSDMLGPTALANLLALFGREPKTQQHQVQLVAMFDHVQSVGPRARGKSLQAESKDSCDARRFPKTIRFPEFLCMMELFENELIRDQEQHVESIVKDLKMAERDVAGFRKIFFHWAREPDASTLPVCQLPGGVNSEGTFRHKISQARLWRFVKEILGDALTPEVKAKLDRELLSIANKGELDWLGFLRIMCWMADTDYGGISSLAVQGDGALLDN